MFYIENIFWTSPLMGCYRYRMIQECCILNQYPIEDRKSLIESMILSSDFKRDKEENVEELTNFIRISSVNFSSNFIYNLCINLQSTTPDCWWRLLYLLHNKRLEYIDDNLYVISEKKYFMLIEKLTGLVEKEQCIKFRCSVVLLDHLLKNRSGFNFCMNNYILPTINNTIKGKINNLSIPFIRLNENIEEIRKMKKVYIDTKPDEEKIDGRWYFHHILLALIYHHTGLYWFSPLYNGL